MTNTKQQVREFYDQIGWSHIGEGLYQNARYEDLRLVSRKYIHKCHLRVKRHLSSSGMFLLDAGSGPVQWPEYLTYSDNYRFHLCVDLSIVALKEARTKLGKHGLYVVADIANLPFQNDSIDGEVSMHAIHHLPVSEHKRAFLELFRVLKPGHSAVIVNGWDNPMLMRVAEPLIQLGRLLNGRGIKRKKKWSEEDEQVGTHVKKLTPAWLKKEMAGIIDYDIYAWRSLSPRFMRWFVRPKLGGQMLLNILFWLEDVFPRFFGNYGQYPIIVMNK